MGNGTVSYTFDTNTTGSPRPGTLTIGGQIFALNQVGPNDGFCGSSNGQTFPSTPVGGLCSAGTASTVTGGGPWAWSCVGVNGGTTAACSVDYSACGNVWIDGTSYYNTSIQAAYDAAYSGAILKMQAVAITEDLQFDIDQNVTLEGGFDGCTYYLRDEDSATAIIGELTIGGAGSGSGSVTIENIAIE
jgi:hypothetical protein